MKYAFSVFVLDTESQLLSCKGEEVVLSRQHYAMLKLLVTDATTIHSKDALIEHVWNGRFVTENSIDQCISKLRKILGEHGDGNYIETIYGKGVRFVPKVKAYEEKAAPTVSWFSKKWAVFIALFLLLAVVLPWLMQMQNPVAQEKPLIMVMHGEDQTNASVDVAPFFEQLIRYSNAAQLKSELDKPENLSSSQFIERQWSVAPNLKVVTVQVSEAPGLYTLTVNIEDRLATTSQQVFSGPEVGALIREASRWLNHNFQASKTDESVDQLLPDDAYSLELYIRGIAALKAGNIEKAAQTLELCLQEQPQFHLARLELADARSKQGRHDESLALLDTLGSQAVFPLLEIDIATLRADVLDTLGKYDEAIRIYQTIIQKYGDDPKADLYDLRYNLSYVYASQGEHQKAKAVLVWLHQHLDPKRFPEKVAHVHQKLGSSYQTLGRIDLAQFHADQALEKFIQLDDLLGQAKTLGLLGRIATHQSNYAKAENYIEQSVAINRSRDYKLGTGASINELIYVLMKQGHFKRALQLSQEMESIALDIDYLAMLLAAKQLAADITRAQKKWDTAKIYLDEHLKLAEDTHHKRAMLKNRLLKLDFYLDQGLTGPVPELIDYVQQYIQHSQEHRLQPRLNQQIARHRFLTDKPLEAIALLETAEAEALKTDDGETLIEIQLILIRHYLKSKQIESAWKAVLKLETLEPQAYPFLLLKSKVLNAQGDRLQALEWANQCKRSANEWWNRADEIYLQNLKMQP